MKDLLKAVVFAVTAMLAVGMCVRVFASELPELDKALIENHLLKIENIQRAFDKEKAELDVVLKRNKLHLKDGAIVADEAPKPVVPPKKDKK